MTKTELKEQLDYMTILTLRYELESKDKDREIDCLGKRLELCNEEVYRLNTIINYLEEK